MSFSLSTGNTVNTASSAAVSSSNDTAATIKVTATAGITNGWIQSTGVVAKIYINGSHVASKTVIGNGTYTTAGSKSVSASLSVAKSTSAKSVSWKVEYWQYTDGVEQSLKETDSGTVSVAAKTSYKVSYNANGGSGAPSAQTKWHGTALTLSSVKPTRAGYTFQGWGTASNDTTVDYAAGASYTANKAITLYAIWKVVAPSAPSGLSVVRNSDSKNTLSWTRGENADVTYASIKVERKTDGGAWSQIASVAGTATSYADTTTAADHAYEYRIRASNSTGNSAYATCSTVVYNTPAAPTGITAARSGDNTVALTIDNAAKTATKLEIQRSTDGATWATVSTVEGSPVKSTSDNPGGGTFYYRARNTRGSLASAWSPASNAVVTICAPAAPTLLTPVSGSVVRKALETITFAWAHNPIDGSAQQAAKLRYSTDKGATWVEVAVSGAAASYDLENAFEVNSEVTWSVCTKGAHDDYGPWSDNRTFFVRQAPSLSFAQPSDGFVVENTPIAVRLQYDDPSGELVGMALTVADGASVAYSRDMGAETACDILAGEWTPATGKSYVLTATAQSSSSLSATATREVTVDFALPQAAALRIDNDPETGYAALVLDVPSSFIEATGDTVTVEGAAEGARVEELAVYGNWRQETTEGRNLAERVEGVYVNPTSLVIKELAGAVCHVAKVKPNTWYTISAASAGNRNYLGGTASYPAAGVPLTLYRATPLPAAVESGDSEYLCFYHYHPTSDGTEAYDLQIEEGLGPASVTGNACSFGTADFYEPGTEADGYSAEATVTRVAVGETATFACEVMGLTGAEEVAYRWLVSKDGGAWENTTAAGSTTSSISVGLTEGRMGYKYKCAVTINGITVESNVCGFLVGRGELSATVEAVNICAIGDTALLMCEALNGDGTAAEVLAYEWQQSTDDGLSWGECPFEGRAHLAVPSDADRMLHLFRCSVTATDGRQVTTDAVRLSLQAAPSVMVLTEAVPLNGVATLRCVVNGLADIEPTYRWEYSANGGEWQVVKAVEGQSVPEYAVQATAALVDANRYRCVVTADDGEPRLRCDVEGASGDPSFQWYASANPDGSGSWALGSMEGCKTDTLVPGADGSEWFFSCVVTDGAGGRVQTGWISLAEGDVEANEAGGMTAAASRLGLFPAEGIASNACELAVSSLIEANVTTNQANVGDMATFTCEVEGAGDAELAYQWQFREAGGNWQNSTAAGYDTPSITTQLLAARRNRQYRCVVSVKGEKPTAYERYTGGAPAPSPAFPLEPEFLTGVDGGLAFLVNGEAVPVGAVELRALPDGTADELVVDQHGDVSVIRRVGVLTCDGGEGWAESGACFALPEGTAAANHDPARSGGVCCDRLQAQAAEAVLAGGQGACVTDGGAVAVCIEGVEGLDGLTALLSERPLTLWYALPQPEESYIGSVDLPELPESFTVEAQASMATSIRLVYTDGTEPAVSASVWRESDNGRVLLDEGLQPGAAVVDRYAPLNVDYAYVVATYAESGAANTVTVGSRLVTPWWFIYFDGGMAKSMLEQSGSRRPRRTKDELRERDGSEWPVLIQGRNKSHEVEFAGWVETKEEADAFEVMAFASGGKVYKGLKGEVFHCHAEADITDCYDCGEDGADVKVSLSRVRGGAL